MKIINPIRYSSVDICNGFWGQRQAINATATVNSVYDRFCDTGRFDAFKFDWQEGMPGKPHIFWDSDVAKWIEGAAHIIRKKSDAALERIIESTVDLIEKNIGDDGYFNIYFTVIEPEGRFTDRSLHELYCAGHLIEAAIAYYEATGRDRFLNLMRRYADYIDRRFRIDRDTAFVTPGHQEIELALVKLYRTTGEERYLALSRFFIDERGLREEDSGRGNAAFNSKYNQSHLPVREQMTAEGHCVRALYLYRGMAELAIECGDVELISACKAVFDDIIEHKMYLTGGVGSPHGEAFTTAYDLPNDESYSETCASIAMILFAARMLSFGADSKYSDVIERVLYNSFLSGISPDGRAFFYDNPLELQPRLIGRHRSMKHSRYPLTKRVEVFTCSCCPPNVIRFMAALGDLIYGDDGETVYVHQYVNSTARIEREQGAIGITQETRFPEDGKIKITVTGGDTRLAVRIPEWDNSYSGETERGYAYFNLHDGDSVELNFDMTPRLVESRPELAFNAGKCALMRGPIVYCMESADNGENIADISIDPTSEITEGRNDELDVITLTLDARRRASDSDKLYRSLTTATKQCRAIFIPYYSFANREEPSEMQVWTRFH